MVLRPCPPLSVTEARKRAIAGCIRETLQAVQPVVVVAIFVLPVLTLVGAFLLLKLGCPVPIAVLVLMLFVYGPYVGMVHVYSMGRLHHLIADLPRTSERITLRETNANAMAHMLPKLPVGAAALDVGGLPGDIDWIGRRLLRRPSAPHPALCLAFGHRFGRCNACIG